MVLRWMQQPVHSLFWHSGAHLATLAEGRLYPQSAMTASRARRCASLEGCHAVSGLRVPATKRRASGAALRHASLHATLQGRTASSKQPSSYVLQGKWRAGQSLPQASLENLVNSGPDLPNDDSTGDTTGKGRRDMETGSLWSCVLAWQRHGCRTRQQARGMKGCYSIPGAGCGIKRAG